MIFDCSQIAKSGTEVGNIELIACAKIGFGTSEKIKNSIYQLSLQTDKITCTVTDVTLLDTHNGRNVEVGEVQQLN